MRIYYTNHFTERNIVWVEVFSDESYCLVRSALDLFGELVEWLPANILEPYINDLLHTVCSFLETPQHCIYEVVCEYFSTIKFQVLFCLSKIMDKNENEEYFH